MSDTRKMIEQLNALTSGEIRGDLELFSFLYGEVAKNELKLDSIKDFSFWDNGQSVIVYEGQQAIFDCNYEICYGLKRLTTCYNKEGLYHEFKNY